MHHLMPGSRIGPRGGISRSTPPSGSKMSRIAFTSSAPVFGGLFSSVDLFSSVFRISRASCSMDRPFCAARMRSLRFVISGSCRMVMLAMQSMISLQSMIA